MDIKQLEKVSHAGEILQGLRDLCMVLQTPSLKDVPATVFSVIGTGLESAQSLLEETANGVAGKEGNQ